MKMHCTGLTVGFCYGLRIDSASSLHGSLRKNLHLHSVTCFMKRELLKEYTATINNF